MIKKREEAFLSVEGLNKRYQELIAVDNVHFTVNKGEIFGFLGPNGAGKTTTIRMLCGLIKADSGNVKLDGHLLANDYKKVKHLIGLCPQEIIIWELLTCLEQLVFTGMSYGLDSDTAKKKGNQILEDLGLGDKRNKLAKTLSGGMQRRLNIALALVHDPKLIILDEPQAGLDPQSRILVRDYIKELAKEKTVILTTHDMDEADRLSDRIAIIDHGKILYTDTPEQLKKKSGEGDILQIRIKNINQQSAAKLLNAIPQEVKEKKYSDGYLFLSAKNILELVPKVSTIMENNKIQVEDMTVRKRTLEDVFIAVTGRGLRE
ncbi:antibiotic ABC transporter ATP-binding protein [Anaerocolumna cellulosilytica]|uniref:Antibiotic ABC transporter ATP-binding protein n=1 Tax=Anaerocolumna cellulosilytica TaxID=433286 RepID=A0A6S6QSV0_9FIRM|nr:ABC transporter ATP-binding protein [Anaerocolumna cellulosilytica]MBB5196455.1 ABC-2 type transport system ATP-binding protein [Anaerocolumna cellulosilytica]BCJ94423.1 antibiotic ABC transporter ATP-binding protein [Anaerocolumna cellulosilytica]